MYGNQIHGFEHVLFAQTALGEKGAHDMLLAARPAVFTATFDEIIARWKDDMGWVRVGAAVSGATERHMGGKMGTLDEDGNFGCGAGRFWYLGCNVSFLNLAGIHHRKTVWNFNF